MCIEIFYRLHFKSSAVVTPVKVRGGSKERQKRRGHFNFLLYTFYCGYYYF